MKKVLWSISILIVILATLQVRSLQTYGYRGGSAFTGLPIDVARPVEVGWDDGALSQQSARERRDQVRDWLLLAVVSNAGLPESDVSAALVDLPPARYGYLKPVSAFEYGETRSRSIGGGRVIAMVPAKQSEDARADSLAHIADEYRMSVGNEPKELLVFEYLDCRRRSVGNRHTASLDRRGVALHRADRISPRDRQRHRLAGRFLTQVDDLLEAHVTSSSLIARWTQAAQRLPRRHAGGCGGALVSQAGSTRHNAGQQEKIDAFDGGGAPGPTGPNGKAAADCAARARAGGAEGRVAGRAHGRRERLFARSRI